MSREPSRPVRLRDVRRIVAVGDSITELGAEPGGYVSLLEHALAALDAPHPIEIVNAGVPLGSFISNLEAMMRLADGV